MAQVVTLGIHVYVLGRASWTPWLVELSLSLDAECTHGEVQEMAVALRSGIHSNRHVAQRFPETASRVV